MIPKSKNNKSEKIFFRKCQKRTSNLFWMQRTFWAINALIWILINWTFFSLLNWTGKWLITNFENLFYGLNFSSKIYNPCLLYRRCKFKTNKFNFFIKISDDSIPELESLLILRLRLWRRSSSDISQVETELIILSKHNILNYWNQIKIQFLWTILLKSL